MEVIIIIGYSALYLALALDLGIGSWHWILALDLGTGNIRFRRESTIAQRLRSAISNKMFASYDVKDYQFQFYLNLLIKIFLNLVEFRAT